MRVSTRIVSGAGILLAMAALAIIHVTLIYRMRTLTQNLVVSFEAAETAEAVRDDLAEIEAHAQKALIPRQRDTKNLDAVWEYFKNDLNKLKAKLGANPGLEEALKLEAAWNEYRSQWDQLMVEFPTNPVDPVTNDELRKRGSALLGPFEEQAVTVSEVIQKQFGEDVQYAASLGHKVEILSWIVGGIALVIAVVSIFLLRSVNESFRRLTRGTRMISQGQFWHRLPTDGGDEFAELAADFNSMSQRLGELDNMKKDFVSHVSHELKAPLASILQTFHLLLGQIPGTLNEKQKRLLRLSNSSAERLAAMVGNLLDVSRMEAGSMEYTVAPVDLLALARTVAEEFEVQANEREITIHVEGNAQHGTRVECDRDRMIQVIGNLFENALKFSPRGADIHASLEERLAGGDRLLVFCVRDSGVGVPNEHKERIFRKFHQVKQGKKLTGQGVGLGLAICCSIIEAHRGRIWVEDNPSGGSVFCFELPAMAGVEATTA